MHRTTAKWALCAAMVTSCGGVAQAQDATTADLPFTASIGLQEYYTDNVYYSRPLYNQPRLGDWVTVLTPSLGYFHSFEKGQIDVGASATLGRYATYSSENFDDLLVYADGSYRFSPTTLGVWGARLARNHEARSSVEPSDQTGSRPTVYWKTSTYGALSHRIGDDDTVKLGFTYDGYDFADASTTVAPFRINNDDRDRDVVTVGTRFTHRLNDRNSVYVEGTFDWRNYRSSIDDAGYARSSQGVRSAVGWQTKVGENGKLEVYGGLIYQSFQDARFADVVTPDLGGRYTWQANGASVTAEVRRKLEETTLSGVSSYLNTTAQIRMTQDLSNNIRLYGGLALADLDFQSSNRRDQLTNFWLGIRKYVTPNLYFGAEGAFEERESNNPVNDYTETRIMARIGVDTEKAFDPENVGEFTSTAGFYVGLGGEISHLGTMLDGQRQNTGGSLTADFGAFGIGGRIIGGWGTDIDQTYLGVEGDFGLSAARWDHSRLPGGRVFSVEERNSVGLGFLAGHRLPGGSLFYGRVGVRSTRFDTSYATARASANWSDRLTGFEYGLGLQTPISPHLAVSMEYDQVRYPDYQAIAGNATPDRFGNVEDSMRFALTYHFGGIPGASAPMPQAMAFGGAYWGLQAGLGAMSSLNRGNRDAGSVLTADRGDHGISGSALVGYNYQKGRFVVGGELDAELSREAWDQSRTPNGRTYSLRNDGSIGASARLGYVLDGGALVYGRIGGVATHFRNDFQTTGTTLASSYWRGAVRYGAGLEVPLAQSSRLRFDYSFTDYGTLTLATGAGPETYDTRKSSFSVGFLKSF